MRNLKGLNTLLAWIRTVVRRRALTLENVRNVRETCVIPAEQRAEPCVR